MTSHSELLEPVRFSRLKLFAKSAAHYESGYGAETGPMRKGTALHAYLLGGPEKVVVYEGGRRDNRIAAWRDFQVEHAGKHILSPTEVESVVGMRQSIERHRRAMELLDDGVQENRIEWDIGGRACAGTPDVVRPKNGRKRVVELKSCQSSAPNLFKWRGKNMAYPAQVAWYQEGCERTMSYEPGPVDEVFVVAVESTAPYPVTVFRMRDSILELGRKQWRIWWEALRVCEAHDYYPAYAESDVDWEDESGDDEELDWGDAAE